MQERAAWLAWAQIPGIGPVALQRLQHQFGSLATAWSASLDAMQTVNGIGPTVLKAIATHRNRLDPEAFLAHHSQANPCFWTPADAAYPRLLREIPDPPAVLYYQGNAALLDSDGHTPAVAIVGTRDPSEYAKRWTHKLAVTLAKQGIVVVSGMAEGIDTQAHLGCLEANGPTIAIVGTGTDIAYPPRNEILHRQLLARGLVVSEYPAGTAPQRAHFPRRNRLIAALSRATLVMEAPQRSGALITAYLANDYGRDVYVLPGTLDNPRAAGCLGLMTKGAQLILGESHLLEVLGQIPMLERRQPSAPPTPTPKPSGPELSPELASILQQLQRLSLSEGSAGVSFDQLVVACQRPAHEVSSALLQLELQGLVIQLPGMRYVCSG
ncbi:MAG TPA: DNA-processing protein DprA [Stenomitos sp.]